MLFLDNMSNSRFLFESKVWCLAIIHCYKNSRWDWLKATGAWKLKEDRHQLSYSGTETLMNEHQKPYWLKLSPMDYQRPEAISEHPYGKTSLIALGWMIWSGGLHVHISLFFSLFLFLFLTFHWHIRADLKKPIEREREEERYCESRERNGFFYLPRWFWGVGKQMLSITYQATEARERQKT